MSPCVRSKNARLQALAVAMQMRMLGGCPARSWRFSLHGRVLPYAVACRRGAQPGCWDTGRGRLGNDSAPVSTHLSRGVHNVEAGDRPSRVNGMT